MCPLTADTITDEQIRKLWLDLEAAHDWNGAYVAVHANVLTATAHTAARRAYRKRCAVILNARQESK